MGGQTLNETTPTSDEPSRLGCLVATALIFLPLVAFALTDGDQLSDEWMFLLLGGLMLALPFGYLALDGTKAWLPWAVAIGLTVFFWGALIVSAWIAGRNQSGMNFGIVLVMLASPFVITGCTWAAVQGVRRSIP